MKVSQLQLDTRLPHSANLGAEDVHGGGEAAGLEGVLLLLLLALHVIDPDPLLVLEEEDGDLPGPGDS